MLNNDDIQTLMEGLDALEKVEVSSAFSASLLVMAFASDKQAARSEIDQEMEKVQKKAATRKDKIILIKAKLIAMKDQNTVKEASDFLKKPGA